MPYLKTSPQGVPEILWSREWEEMHKPKNTMITAVVGAEE